MKNYQPWLRDRTLLAIPLGWRRCAWNARLVAAEHALAVTLSVAWAPPDSLATPALAVSGDVNPSSMLPRHRQDIQRLGLRRVSRCAAQASRYCMACSSEDWPSNVRLRSGDFVDVIATLCIECQQVAEEEDGAFWPVMSRFDPLSREEVDDLVSEWGPEEPAPDDDPDVDEASNDADIWPDE